MDISSFITYIKEYSEKNNREIEVTFNAEWNKSKAIYVSFNIFDEDECEYCFLSCRITDEGYYFDNIGYWNVNAVEELLGCMKCENRGILPNNIYINNYDFDRKWFGSVAHFLKCHDDYDGESNKDI